MWAWTLIHRLPWYNIVLQWPALLQEWTGLHTFQWWQTGMLEPEGLTCGAIPSPSVTQDHPVDASATHCKQAGVSLYPQIFAYFPPGSRGNHHPISILVRAGGQDVGCVTEDQCHIDSKWRCARHHVMVPFPSVSRCEVMARS